MCGCVMHYEGNDGSSSNGIWQWEVVAESSGSDEGKAARRGTQCAWRGGCVKVCGRSAPTGTTH